MLLFLCDLLGVPTLIVPLIMIEGEEQIEEKQNIKRTAHKCSCL